MNFKPGDIVCSTGEWSSFSVYRMLRRLDGGVCWDAHILYDHEKLGGSKENIVNAEALQLLTPDIINRRVKDLQSLLELIP